MAFSISVPRMYTVAATGALLVCGHLLQGYQETVASKPNYDPPVNLVRGDFPAWPYPHSARVPKKEDDGKPLHVPGSSKAFTETEINGSTSTIDWFPDSHPKPPAPVVSGKAGSYRACGECHLIDGRGKPDTADLQSLPVGYFLQQLDDMKNDRRHGSVLHATITSMIPAAKAIGDDDAKLAAEYFNSIPPARTTRVVETDTVPVTHPGPHALQAVDPSGAREPIGTRIIEVPEDIDRSLLRDPTSGFVAYVPIGSIKEGEALAKTGGDGRTMVCMTCHGPALKGMGAMSPPLAGHSPSSTARQLYDFKSGTRDGKNAAAMRPVVAKLSDEDIVNLTAYIASLQP
jgi:cytochrome c553